jgi:hypothetical protein
MTKAHEAMKPEKKRHAEQLIHVFVCLIEKNGNVELNIIGRE